MNLRSWQARILLISGVVFVLALGYAFWPSSEPELPLMTAPAATPTPIQTNSTNLPLEIAKGYSVDIFIQDPLLVGTNRFIQDPLGNLLILNTTKGTLWAIKENKLTLALENLRKPTGLGFSNDRLYINETDQVSSFNYNAIEKVIVTDRRRVEGQSPVIFDVVSPVTKKVYSKNQGVLFFKNQVGTHDILQIEKTNIIRYMFDLHDKPIGSETFIKGLNSPIDIIIHKDGAFYILDGTLGAIYRVTNFAL